MTRGLPRDEAARRVRIEGETRLGEPVPTSSSGLEAIRTTVREEISRARLTPGAKRQKTRRPR